MSAVQRARMLYYENSGYSFSNLKLFDVSQAIRIRSLQYLEQVTNLCQKIRLTPYTYQDQSPEIKLKFLQSYQYSILYSTNLKNMCDQKQLELDTHNKTLKQQIQAKRNAIKQHKKKVERRKHEYRDMKLNKAKLVCKHFQKEMEELKNKQNELNQIKTKLQQELEFGRNHILQQKYHTYQSFQPQTNVSYNNYTSSNSGTLPNSVYGLNIAQGRNSSQNGSQMTEEQIKGMIAANFTQKLSSNSQIPSSNGQRPSSIHQMQYSTQKSSSYRQSDQPSHSEIVFDEENRIQEMEAKKSSKRALLFNSKSQKPAESIIVENTKPKVQSKNMIQSKVDIKFRETVIGEKDDDFLNESLKPLSIVSMEKSKSNVSKKSSELNTNNVLNSPTSKVRIIDQTFKDELQEQNDTVNQLYDFDLAPESKRQKPSPKNNPRINSQISKGGSNSFIESDDSFYNKKLAIDSNMSRNDLMNSKSGITAKQTDSVGNLFNQRKIKRKDHEDEKTIKSEGQKNDIPLLNQQPVRLSSSIDSDDRNLWMSKGGANQVNENVQNLFNAPKKKSSEIINMSYGSMKDNQAFESPRRSDSFNDVDDVDDLELGFSTVESKIQKKNKEPNKLPLKVTSSRLEDVAEESESEITTKQNTKIIIPPVIPKTEDESAYEDDFEDENQNKSHVKLEVEDQKEQQPVINNKSQIQINVSPNNSFTDVIKEDEKVFPDLTSEKFQLKQEHKSHLSNQSEGIFVQQSNQTQNPAVKEILLSNATDTYNKNFQQVSVSNDFMDDFIISEQSNIGKRSTGLKKTSKLTSQKNPENSYNINVLNNEKELTFTESIHKPVSEAEDQLLELGSGLLLSTKPISKGTTKKPQTMNLIESTTFDENHTEPKTLNHQSKSITDSINLPEIKTSVLESRQDLQKQNTSNDTQKQYMKLLKLNNPVLESKQNDKIDEQDEVQEDIDFELEEDNSKFMQSEKQEIERKLVKIMRNKHKISEKIKYDSRVVQKQIQSEIKNLLNINTSKSNQADWKLIQKTFQSKIKQINKQQKGITQNIKTKITQIEQRNRKLIEKEKIEKEKARVDVIKQESEESISDLNYSQSIIKDSFKTSNLNKKNLKLQTQSDIKNSSMNKMTNSSIIGDDAMTMSLKEKSMIGQKNLSQLPQIMQNNSFEADSIYNKSNLNETDDFGIPQLNEESKFMKKNDTLESMQRSNNLISTKNEQRPNQTSKSKYVKTITPTAKGTGRESSVSRLQENKYVSIQDPLNNQISTNKSLGKKTIENDDDDEF